MAEKERLFRPVDKKVSGVWLACDVVKGSQASHGRHFVGIRRLVLLQQAIRQDVPRCGAFRVGTVRFQPLCAYGQTAADGSAWQTAYSRMDTHRCFRQGNKNVFTDTFPEPQVTTIVKDGVDLPVSTPEQAFLECLLLAPQQYSYMDLYYIMEQLTTLRPEMLQRHRNDQKPSSKAHVPRHGRKGRTLLV